MPEPSATPPAHHEADRQRFVIPSDPEPAVLEYRLEGDCMVIDRTFVPPALRGGGVASQLTVAALEHARARQLCVRPACSYVEVFLQRHPEWADLRA